ncbi:cyclic nucleotide-binding domain-containing protein [Sorangium sp. So ce861]|uniref:cyclic nucleotide-binding domain-containing protein n=1 Tax=Sorangium sp. So ce861 TaxID=3133323 RepID=UPI003F62ACE9
MSTGFEFLTQDDERLLLEKSTCVTYRPGEQILEEGSRRQGIFIVRSGLVGVEVAHLGRGVALRQLGPGAIFGEMSFLESAAASASVVAREECTLDVIEGPYVHSLLASVPGLAARFYQSLAIMLAQRLRENTAMLPPLLVEDVPQVNRFHAARTGQAGTNNIPPKLIDTVEQFKFEMMIADRMVKEAKHPEAEIQEKVSAACQTIVSALREHIERERHLEKGIGAYVFRETFSLFMLSRTVDRCYTKPRGYAGDFYTIEMMYNDEPAGDGRLGRFIDHWGLELEACRAVKNRRGVLSRALREACRVHGHGQVLVTSLASGPARELFDLFAEGGEPPDIKATCIDIDNQALAYAAGIAEELGVMDRFSFAQDNVVRLAHGRGRTVLKPQHMIYSIGLTDYLRDDLVVSLLNCMHDKLLPGGIAVVGNFGVNNPSKAFMDHVLEWELIHRSADDLKTLFARSKFGSTPVEVRAEEAQVNLFAFCTKT